VDAEAWDERYRAADRLWSATPNIFVANRLADVEPGVGLDLASGEGRNAVWLAERGWDMTAVDFSSVALDRGRALSDKVRFIEADVFSWEPEGSFDLVLIAYLQVEAEPLSDLVRRAREWLDLILEWLGALRVIEGGIARRPVEVDGDVAYARDTLVRARRV